MATDCQRHASSFRDPSGFVYRGDDGVLYRQVNASYEAHYRRLMDSGLYADLVGSGQLIEHEEVSLSRAVSSDAVAVLRPRELPFLSWAYEWSFSALQDAALLTLQIQRRALESGMCLKDASHFNVQFDGSSAVLIDSLSFESYEEGKPWQAYGQFCRHFLAPLALMSYRDVALSRLLVLYLDGIPLDLASKLLPWRSRFSPGLMMHLHLHARFVRKYSDTSSGKPSKNGPGKLSKRGLLALLDSLENVVRHLKWEPSGTEWADYYDQHSYSSAAFDHKKQVVARFLESSHPEHVWDLGANVGLFSELAVSAGARTYAFDIDPACVEQCYRRSREEKQRRLVPLFLDLTNPTPAIGWANHERAALLERGRPDVIMALALIHHLAISNNIPLLSVATLFARIARRLIIEWVPKPDPQVQRLLQSRVDIYSDYHRAGFEAAFSEPFELLEAVPVGSDGRVLYLMQRRQSDPANGQESFE